VRTIPVVILLEDLHWGDRLTVQFLDRALRDLGDQPLFVVALARPEVHEVFPGLWAERQFQEIRLKELPRKAIERLVRHVLENRALPEIVDTIARLSEGNAFYLEELIRWAAEGRERELPQTVIAMVQSRLRVLGETSRRLLRAASIFGEVFWAGGVAALLGATERVAIVRDQLTALVERELLVRRKESRFPGQDEYTFRHALLREGAYDMLTEEDRVLGHRLAAEWLMAYGEQDALLLAEHFEKSIDGERAGHYYLRAAEQVNSAGDSATAIAYVQRGLACNVSGELRIALLGTFCEAHFFQLDLVTAAQPQAEELVRIARAGSAPWIQAMFITLIGAMQARRYEECAAALRSLLQIEPALEVTHPLALALSAVGTILVNLGRIEEASAVVARLTAIVQVLGERTPLASCLLHGILATHSVSAWENPASGLWHSNMAVAIAETNGHRKYRDCARIYACMNQWHLGASAEAEHGLKTITLPDEEMGSISSIRPFVLAWLLADRDVGEARQWASHLVASGQARHLWLDEGRGHWVFAEVLRRAGEFEKAESKIQAALSLLGTTCPLDVPGAQARSQPCGSRRVGPPKQWPWPKMEWPGMHRWAHAATSFAAPSCASFTPSASKRQATTRLPRLPLPERERVSSQLLTKSATPTIARASSKTCPRTGGRSRSPGSGSARILDGG
jgi:tetratricopeptide (TPR) repeat protein